MRIGVVFNPRSGAREGGTIRMLVQEAISGSGHQAVFLDVHGGRRIEHGVAQLVSEIDVVATIGGDGTLNGVVNGVLRSEQPETPVAFFPVGRGRDTARTLPSFTLPRIGFEPIDWQNVLKVDVAQAQSSKGVSRYFINVASIGLSGEAAGVASRIPRQFGSFSYVLAAARAFLSTRPASLRMRLDGERRLDLDDVLLIAACNGRSFGGGIYIAPEAGADDGLLEMVVVRNANLADLALNLSKLKSGRPFSHPAISSWRASTVVMEDSHLSPLELDGDPWGSPPVTFTTIPSALNWIGPKS